jgi:RNA polymerase sigma-70 factor (ECF subfamily)
MRMDSVKVPHVEEPLASPELVARTLAGDRACREELARACLARVRRTVLLAVGSRPDADDVVQNAMSRIFSALAEFRGEAKLTTWIDRITVNAIRDHYRRRPVLSMLFSGSSTDEQPAPAQWAPDRDLENRRLAESLRRHLAQLKPPKRIALMLFAAYGYSVTEIAAMTDCTVETAKKRLQHGRRELMARVRKDPYVARLLTERGSCPA